MYLDGIGVGIGTMEEESPTCGRASCRPELEAEERGGEGLEEHGASVAATL